MTGVPRRPDRDRGGRRGGRPGRRRRRIVGRVRCRYVYVDGLAVGDIRESLLTERRILGDGGSSPATVVVDSVTGKVVGGPTDPARGFSDEPTAFDEVVPLVTEALNDRPRKGSPTRIRSSRSCGARSAAGSTTATAAGR